MEKSWTPSRCDWRVGWKPLRMGEGEETEDGQVLGEGCIPVKSLDGKFWIFPVLLVLFCTLQGGLSALAR